MSEEIEKETLPHWEEQDGLVKYEITLQPDKRVVFKIQFEDKKRQWIITKRNNHEIIVEILKDDEKRAKIVYDASVPTAWFFDPQHLDVEVRYEKVRKAMLNVMNFIIECIKYDLITGLRLSDIYSNDDDC